MFAWARFSLQESRIILQKLSEFLFYIFLSHFSGWHWIVVFSRHVIIYDAGKLRQYGWFD